MNQLEPANTQTRMDSQETDTALSRMQIALRIAINNGSESPEKLLSAEETTRVYSKWAANYEADCNTLSWRAPHHLLACVEACLPVRCAEHVLDIGCGTGLICQQLRAKGYAAEFFGFDLCSEMLAVAEARGVYHSLRIHSLLNFPWPYTSSSFDLLVCNGVLRYTVSGGSSIMGEMVRLSRPGAYIVFQVLDVSWPAYMSAAEMLEKAGLWRLVKASEAFDNFTSICEDEAANGIARIRVYQRLGSEYVTPVDRELVTPVPFSKAGQLQGAVYWDQVRTFYCDNWTLFVANTIVSYECSSYAFVSAEVAANFFPGSSVAVWGAFASTFLARPFGGLLFGYLSDAYGRKPALIGSVWATGIATVGQGLGPRLPYLGASWMVLCRLAQGLGTGGAKGGLAVYVSESAPKNIAGMAIQSTIATESLGTILACGLAWGLKAKLSKKQMLSWGWRVPFLVAAAPALYTMFTTGDIEETGEFQALQSQREEDRDDSFATQFRVILRDHWPQGLMAIGGLSAMLSLSFLNGMYMYDWMVKQGISSGTASTIMITGLGLSVMASSAVGYAADTYGVAKVNLAAALSSCALAIPQYWLLHRFPRSPAVLAVGGTAVNALLLGGVSTIHFYVAGLFPAEVRGTSVALYSSVASVIGGLAPVICAAWRNPIAPGYYTLLASTVTSFTMGLSLWMHQAGGRPLQVSHIIDQPF